MIDLGTYEGTKGLDKLLQETNAVLAQKNKVVVAIAGLPGAGKTFMVKRFVRLGFGAFGRKEILVIDDNTIYSTVFWRLKWEKIKIGKETASNLWEEKRAKIVFFANWIPSRFLESADIYVILQLSEDERTKRLKKREKKAPEKFHIQKAKYMIPLEDPFSCPRVITIINNSRGMYMWHFWWLVKRLTGRLKNCNILCTR